MKRILTILSVITLMSAVAACGYYKAEETNLVRETEVVATTTPPPTPTPTAEPTPIPTAEPTPTTTPDITYATEADMAEEKAEDKKLYCTLSIRCDSVLDNIDKLSDMAVLPENGIILPETCVEIKEGESVFELLLRMTKKNGIPFEFSSTPIYNSVYIEGINNLYEFDCGELSGWMYKLNGAIMQKSCSETYLKDGDIVEWVYTCDSGKDIGREIE